MMRIVGAVGHHGMSGASMLRRDKAAVTSIEYALIAGVIMTALIISVPAVGPEISTIFNSVSTHL